MPDGQVDMNGIKGLVWRKNDEIIINFTRPFIPNLSAMPLPLHHLLPLKKYRMPMIQGPFTFVVTSRGCPAGCTYCIKHVSYQFRTRVRTPENIMEELWVLKKLGMNNIHMYADLFTVSRDQVMGLCELMIKENINIKWTCNSRVDYVDEEMLQMMSRAGNWLISWGIESGNEQILRHARKGAYPDKAQRALSGRTRRAYTTGDTSLLGFPARQKKLSDKLLISPKVCRSISPCSMWLLLIRELPFSSKLSKMGGSVPVRVGNRLIWIKVPCWITRSYRPNNYSIGRSARFVNGLCDQAQ